MQIFISDGGLHSWLATFQTAVGCLQFLCRRLEVMAAMWAEPGMEDIAVSQVSNKKEDILFV